jgi:hypothetical protein
MLGIPVFTIPSVDFIVCHCSDYVIIIDITKGFGFQSVLYVLFHQ